ncbi:hypothetical protein CTRI78_v001466 [Colletotrichum trifolii]|uniref:Uncharacterized protein n=1 Tax=Colletotrichum trifolii TaxID=5466 RepID=A0A4R8RPC5_COLTR|nr:hypothetical protein CTRI78_v001466 [Colletotrichum trifolii]
MPPKKATNNGDAATSSHGCTDAEVKLMLAILNNIARPSGWDLDKIAEDVGATNARSASERIRVAANKHGWFTASIANDNANGGGRGSGAATPRGRKTPGSGAGRKKKQPVNEDSDEEAELETPTKKKARTAKAVKMSALEDIPVNPEGLA